MSYETFDVPVEGGNLRVGKWGAGSTVVLAAHGLTASHVWFRILADQLGDEFSLVAPDLRGRGASYAVTGPFTVTQHAADLSSVLAYLGVTADVAIGHSMGGEVALVCAARYPEQVRRLVLIDGGLPLGSGSITTGGRPVVGRAFTESVVERLQITYPSADAYVSRWRSHSALAAEWNEYMQEAYEYDLMGTPPQLWVRVRGEAITGDRESIGEGTAIREALRTVGCPMTLVRAGRGILDHEPGVYSDEVVARWRDELPGLRSVLVPETNHYTALIGRYGSERLVQLLMAELGYTANGPDQAPAGSADR